MRIALSLIGVLVFGAGCATRPETAAFQPVSSEAATLRWRRENLSLTGEGVLARSRDGSVLLRLYKQSPTPLLELQLGSTGTFSAQGPLARSGWTGPYASAPAPLSTWVSFLSIYQRAADLPPGQKELHGPGTRIAYSKTSRSLQSLSVNNTDTAEAISGIFQTGDAADR